MFSSPAHAPRLVLLSMLPAAPAAPAAPAELGSKPRPAHILRVPSIAINADKAYTFNGRTDVRLLTGQASPANTLHSSETVITHVPDPADRLEFWKKPVIQKSVAGVVGVSHAAALI